MSVVKLIGRADDYELVFTQNKITGLWDATVPFTEDGVYVLDLWAVDEAGNWSRYAKALFIVDTTNIHCKFRFRILSFNQLREKPYEIKLRRCDCVTEDCFAFK